VPLLLDSTVLIDVLCGRPEATRRLLADRAGGQVPWVCAINVEEVWRGVRAAEEPAVARLFDGLRIAPLGRREGERAAAWRREFAERGVTLSQADCLVAAAALGVGAHLATGNGKDFPMAELQVEDWPAGR